MERDTERYVAEKEKESGLRSLLTKGKKSMSKRDSMRRLPTDEKEADGHQDELPPNHGLWKWFLS